MHSAGWSGSPYNPVTSACMSCNCYPCVCAPSFQLPSTHIDEWSLYEPSALGLAPGVGTLSAGVLDSSNDPTISTHHGLNPYAESWSLPQTNSMFVPPYQNINMSMDPQNTGLYAAPTHTTFVPPYSSSVPCICRPWSGHHNNNHVQAAPINGQPANSHSFSPGYGPAFHHQSTPASLSPYPEPSLESNSSNAGSTTNMPVAQADPAKPKPAGRESSRSQRRPDIAAMRKLGACDECRKRKSRCDVSHIGERKPYKEFVNEQ